MPLPNSLRVNERPFFLESRHVKPPFVHGCHFWSVLFGFCAVKLFETSRYRRNWLLSACAYNTRQQENMRLIKSMRLTGSMRLIKSAKTR